MKLKLKKGTTISLMMWIQNLKVTKSPRKIVNILTLSKEVFVKPKTDDKTGNYKTDREEAHDKELDTTGVPDLENEESAEQSKKQKGKGLKTLTPNQMLSRLPISLAQLKVRSNSEKLKR